MDDHTPTRLTDRELLAETRRAAEGERHTTARLIALLAEVDARRLYLGESCSSLFGYCTRVLRLSEHAAYGRICAARIARRFPVVLERLTAGDVTLTTIELLGTHLTPDNCEALLEAARHKSRRKVEALVAAIAPQPAIASSIRRLPSPRTVEETAPAAGSAPTAVAPAPIPATPLSCPAAPPRRSLVVPLAPERYLMRVTISDDTRRKLQRAQDLLRHSVPSGDPAEVIDRALTVLVEQLEKRRLAATRRPRKANDSTAAAAAASSRPVGSRTRHVPAAVKRAVWSRDQGQCAFVGANGRCRETSFLEIHHVVPYAVGGATVLENLVLRCRAHNVHEAACFFGEELARPGAATPHDIDRTRF